MVKRIVLGGQCALVLALVLVFALQANPVLTPGTWKSITPSVVQTGDNNTCIGQGVAIDPTDPNTIYWGTTPYDNTVGGLFKTTNAGESWRRVAKVTAAWQGASDYLDEPLHVRIDPNDHNHMYAGDGVRGSSQGFFISHDGGENFVFSQGFKDCLAREGIDNQDIYDVAVEPGDFNHVLISYHYRWGWTDTKWNTSSGILESKDGGLTWSIGGFVQTWGSGHAIKFLYVPQKNIGDKNTWLLGTQGNGFWRTSDGGVTWNQVSTANIMHGGGTIYYAQNNTLYTSSDQGVLRSSDNGQHWTSAGYTQSNNCVYGDGAMLYTAPGWSTSSFYVMPENSTGTTWAAYSSQQIGQGPYEMAFDKVNRIMYSSSWNSGIWALKLPATNTAVSALKPANSLTQTKCMIVPTGNRLVVLHKTGAIGYAAGIYNVKGCLIR